MKILSGAYQPDSGSMTLAGAPYAPKGPREALDLGVAMIYQELALAPHLTVEANVMLGQERVTAGLIRRREHRRLVSRGPGVAGASRHPARGGRGDAQRRGPATGRGGPGPGLERPGHRLRRADQLAHRARRLAAVRGDRAAARSRARGRLHQPLPGGSPPGRGTLHGAPRRPGRGLGADGGDGALDDHRPDGGPRPDRALPARPPRAGRGRARAGRAGRAEPPETRRPERSGAARSWGSRGWSGRDGPSSCARSSGSTRSARGGSGSRGSRGTGRRPVIGSARASDSSARTARGKGWRWAVRSRTT